MRSIRLTCFLVAANCAALGAQATTLASADGDTSATSFTVGSLRVIHQRRTTSQTVSVRVFLLGGARQIDARTAGVEPLLLRAASLGSSKYPGTASQRALARIGASTYIDVTDDWVVYSLRTMRAEIDTAWSVFADRIAHPSLGDEAIADARRGMLADLVVANTNPDYLLNQIARPVAYERHPYANDPSGTDRSLRGIRPQALRDYHAAQFVTSRMVLVVVGNVDRATVERLTAATLATMPAGRYSWTPPPPVPLTKTSMTIVPREMETDYIIGIFPGPLANTKDFAAFRLGTGLLGGYLNYEVREQQQLSYAAYAPLFGSFASAGGLYASTPRPERVMELMIKGIEEVGSNTLPFELMPRFVSQFQIENLLSRETNSGQAGALAEAYLMYGDPNALDASFQALKGVSAGNLRSVIARYAPFIHWVFMGDTSRFQRYVR